MREMKKIIILFLLISFCGGNNEVINDEIAIKEKYLKSSNYLVK